ncbi:MAG: SDR family oxidoreductase [Bacteroidales bacterium]|nr:SDR family oxidoreductase [Bacteroidales bacterium]
MNETILITGASGVLGSELTHHFRRSGHTVVATSRSRDNLEALAATIDGPGQIVAIEIDLEQTGAAAALASEIDARGLRPTHLVNNARNLAHLKMPLTGHPGAGQWHAEFHLGVVVPYELTIALAELPSSHLRSVVNISSIYGVVAMQPKLYESPKSQSPLHYGVVKAALIHLTRELAVRLAPNGIRVNAVSYGGIEGRADKAFRQRYAEMAPNGRMLRTNDVAGAVAFLTSEAAAGVTGHNLMVDGGWTIW